MTRLSSKEFRAMNDPLRQLLQRRIEMPMLKRLGVEIKGREVLEVGCGSGYGATLLLKEEPASYLGFDFMPEQVALANQRGLPVAFIQEDATEMNDIPDASRERVVVFGVLHHIPDWRKALREIWRVLRPGGEMYIEEPGEGLINPFDRLFQWGHPVTFNLRDLEAGMREAGFTILCRVLWPGFGFYRARKDNR